jgi:serine/threonine protein kinase
MASDLCPYCGKSAHGTGSSFDCLGRSDQKTVATGSPSFTPTTPADGHFGTPTPQVCVPSAVEATLGTKLSTGTKVGEYQILERIGEGGMGTVYSAVHPIIGKKVAIKVLAGRLAKNKNAIRRFVLEARAVNDIQHPGLVDIFSFGQLTDCRHYYVMEFLEGRNLGDVLRERIRLPMSEAIPIFIEVGQTLVAVHAKGIVHRDLKPENIFLLSTAQVGGQKTKLVDFGLAKLIEGVPAHLSEGGPRTAAGVNVGTPHYMSPEQSRGLKVDARSDLYALGVLLYETVTGRLPFDGATTLDIWQAHVEKKPQPPIEIAPQSISSALNALILRLLAKQPGQRIQTAKEFCTELENLLEGGLPRPATKSPSPDKSIIDLQIEPPFELMSGTTTGSAMIDSGRPAKVNAVHAVKAQKPAAYDEMATTTEDLHPVQLPETAFTEEDRRKEIEELRASLGLHIEEPATDSQEEEQMSALVINLGASRSSLGDSKTQPKNDRRSMTPLGTGPKLRHTTRPIEERKYVPPLAAPLSRSGGMMRTTMEASMYRPSRVGKIIRAVLVVALLIAATVIAIKFVK